MPATIEAAPNRMKQPIITVAPKRQFIRPVSIMKPTAATAITATAVATLPSSVPCSQLSAPTMGPDPAGSTPWAWAAAGRSSAVRPAKRENRRILFGTPGMIGQPPHHGRHVNLGFADTRDAAGGGHPAGAGVIGGQRLFEIAVEAVELFAQVTRAALQIGERIIGIDPHFARGCRHELGKAARAHRRYRVRAPAAFLPYQ